MQHTVLENHTLYEKDSSDAEDVHDIYSYLMPTLETLNKCSHFGVNYNRITFQSWVKQLSPCCAAASTAGALNTLFNHNRHDADSFDNVLVLDVFKLLYLQKLESSIQSIQRKFGHTIQPTLIVLNSILCSRDVAFSTNNKCTSSTPLKVNFSMNLFNKALQIFMSNADSYLVLQSHVDNVGDELVFLKQIQQFLEPFLQVFNFPTDVFSCRYITLTQLS